MGSINDIGVPNQPLGNPPLTVWQKAVRDVLGGSDVPVDQRGVGAPTGVIAMFGGSLAPTGWHLCDGTPHGSSALQSVLGSANAPDLRDRFVVGAGASYAKGATGGAATVTLLAGQSGMPAHAHVVDPPNTGTSTESAYHTHAAPAGYDFALTVDAHTLKAAGGSTYNYVGGYSQNTGNNNTLHTHSVDIPAFWSSDAAAQNASASHENRPPYYALVYIIKL